MRLNVAHFGRFYDLGHYYSLVTIAESPNTLGMMPLFSSTISKWRMRLSFRKVKEILINSIQTLLGDDAEDFNCDEESWEGSGV